MGYQGRTMLREIVLDESRKSSDHIVACGKDEAVCYVDVYSNPLRDDNDGEKGILGSKRGSYDHVNKQNVVPFNFQDPISSTEYVRNYRIDMDHDAFCANNSMLGTGYVKHCNSVKDASLAANDKGVPLEELLDCSSVEQKDGENELIDFEWPDISDFGDIDEMFRNCDFTFGRGSTGTADELSWFSSSSNKPADAFESGLPSSCSELSGLNSTSRHHRTSSIFVDEKDQACNDFRKSPNSKSYCSWSNYDDGHMEKHTPNERAYVVNNISASAIHQRSINRTNGSETSTVLQNNLCMKPFGSQFSPSRKRKDHPSDHTSSTSKLPFHVSTPHSTRVFTKQNLLRQQPSSNKVAAPSHPTELENGISVGHISFANASFVTNSESEINSCGSDGLNYDPKCMEQLQQFSGTETESLSRKRHYRLQRGLNGRTREVSRNTNYSATNVDYLAVQEGSCISSGCDGHMSLEAASLEQLQDAMHQLDDSTKLHIRDSLYRLSRGAKQRRSVSDGALGGTRGVKNGRASNNLTRFLDAETETNPIDRSIAQLLLRSPSGAGTKICDPSYI